MAAMETKTVKPGTLHLELQLIVEGLSVTAITYDIVGLVGLVAKGT